MSILRSEEIDLTVILISAMGLIAFGIDLIRSGDIQNGAIVLILGIVLAVLYFIVFKRFVINCVKRSKNEGN